MRRGLLGVVIVAALVAAAVLGTAGGRRSLSNGVGRLRASISEWRREQRERRAAERALVEGEAPDVPAEERLPVVEVAFAARQGLGPEWADHGWSPHVVEAGRPARLDVSGHGGLLLFRSGELPRVGGLLLRYRALASHGDFLEVRLDEPGGHPLRRVRLERARFPAGADGWTEAWIPLRELNPDGRPVERVALYAWREVGREPLEVEEISFTAASPPTPLPPRVARFIVTCRSPGIPISPLIYGTGTYFVDDGSQAWAMGTTARRWGGNHTSRYNWKLHAWNMDRDWFFRNAPVRSAESFLAENRDHGVASALTVPMLGWVAKDTTSYSFPVSRLGPQQLVAWDVPDSGNGIRPDGKPFPSPLPSTTSVRCDPECIAEWVRELAAAAAAGGPPVGSYILDNEPGIWSRTHRDVHPDPVGYDELLARTVDFATAIRRADPGARIAGPAEWGWQNWFFSGKDVASGTWMRPDRLLHGNVPLIPWYLGKLREHEARTGLRLLDILDVHYYPDVGLGVGTAGRTDPATAALRIRATRSLWDPTYVDESWVDEPVRLIPRLREWVAENYPGRDISIGEWSFGAEGHMSGGLATAEALGRFGTEGLHSAYYWTCPPDHSPAWWAFRAYRNFDGRGARFLDRSVPVRSDARLASLFASRDDGGRHAVLVLLNLSPRSRLDAAVALEGCGAVSSGRTFTYSGGAGGLLPGQAPEAGEDGLRLSAVPYSITVIDLELAPPQAVRSGP